MSRNEGIKNLLNRIGKRGGTSQRESPKFVYNDEWEKILQYIESLEPKKVDGKEIENFAFAMNGFQFSVWSTENGWLIEAWGPRPDVLGMPDLQETVSDLQDVLMFAVAVSRMR